ncbi:hypothetical protein ZIOFF_013986 [Zingiber officinale]|uniref:HIT domain-containing protein n=1 Tax=Zingiber officinale TaxID=94328 RepID=A0A8J5HGN8_ZINOF|nr:hypothetical protein ZIOFF_013986 [Zingiber officinale]
MRRQSAGARYPPLISSMAQRRLSDLSSHLHLPGPASASHSPPPRPCGSTCSATSSCEAEADAEAELGGEKGCVFCRIVRGESPAFMTHFHIIPRKAGDKLWPSESFRRQPLESNQEIVDLVNTVRDLVSSQA